MKKKSFFKEADLELIKHYLIGGAALGGGAALSTSLANHLMDLFSSNKSNPLEKNTLKLIVKKPEKEISQTKKVSTSLLRGPLAITGGVLTTMGSYALVRHLYQKLKQLQLQNELEEAQDKYVSTLEDQKNLNEKSASDDSRKSMGLSETALSAPLAAMLLLSLASGVVSYQTLNKHFPKAKQQSQEILGPKRIQVVYDNPGEKPDTILSNIAIKSLQKEAAARSFIINTVANFSNDSDVAGVVKAAAMGFCEHLKNVFAFEGVNSVFEKTASFQTNHVSSESLNLAANWCARHEGLGSNLALIAASEFADKAPLFFKSAAKLPETIQNLLVEFAIQVNAKVASAVVDKIKAVHLTPFDETSAVNKEVNTGNIDEANTLDLLEKILQGIGSSADKQVTDKLIKKLFKDTDSDSVEAATIADLQTEDSKEAGQS